MHRVTYSMGTSLDGYIVGPDGGFDWSGLAEEIERLRAEPGDGDIAIGGATLAAEAAAHDLIDEYRIRIHPVLVGGGIRFFAQDGREVDLELVETRAYGASVHARCRVARADAATAEEVG